MALLMAIFSIIVLFFSAMSFVFLQVKLTPSHSSYLSCQVPEEQKNAGPHDRLVHVYHFEDNRVCIIVYLEVINVLILKTPCSDSMLSSSFERIYGTYSFLKIFVIH